MNLKGRSIFFFICLFGMTGAVFAQSDYPNKPITLIIPFPPGGVTDVVGREVAKNLTKYLKQPVVVENKAGAGGNIGTLALARSKPDGYTLGIMTVSAMSIAPHITKNLGFNPEKDFTPITNVVKTDGAILANSSTPFNTVKELVVYAKENPGKVSYASVGNGSIPHLTAEMFAQQAGVSLLHVPYKGAAPALQDLLANHINLSFETSLVSAVSNLSSGRLKIIAITGPQRSPAAPNVPTVAESGYPNFSAQGWFGLFGPANLPPAIEDALNKATTAALRDPEVISRFEKLGVLPDPQTQSSFISFLQVENKKWAAVAKTLNLQID
jgi:tripartite-type tricarboxylate transporter receptor subunit TctC